MFESEIKGLLDPSYSFQKANDMNEIHEKKLEKLFE